MKNKDKIAVLIIGMHRSGTSAITRVANLLGLYLGDFTTAASQYNAKGYWEHTNIVPINDEILNTLGSSWYDTMPLPKDWWQNHKLDIYKQKLETILLDDFKNSHLWGIKDPRISILLPLWLPVLQKVCDKIHLIHVYRHPKEVACSLLERSSLSSLTTSLLWLKYNIEALKLTDNCKRLFINYNEIFEDPKILINKIANFFEKNYNEQIENEIKSFIDANLRHYGKRNEVPIKKVPMLSIAEQLYTLIDSEKNNPKKLSRLFQTFLQTNESRLKNYAESENILEKLNYNIASLYDSSFKDEAALLQDKLNGILNSKSWKLTAPLRKINDYVNKLKSKLCNYNA